AVDQLGKTGARLGLTIEQISTLEYSAALAGVELQQLGTMASKALKTVASEVAKGHHAMQLGRTSVQLVDINGRIRDTNDLLGDFAKAVARAGDPAKKLELSQRIFGKAGADAFVTMLNETGGALQNLGEQRAELEAMGGLFTAEQVRLLTTMNDAITKVGYAWRAVKVQLVTELAPQATRFLDWLRVRIAELPGLARSAVAAIAKFTSGDIVERERAAVITSRMLDATLDVVSIAAVESGKLLATAFVEAMTIGLTAVAPQLQDIARDIFAPLLNPILKFSGMEEITPSITGQLKATQAQLDSYKKYITDVARVRVAEQWDLEGNRGRFFQWIAERRVAAADEMAMRKIRETGDPSSLQMKIKSLEDAKAMESMERRANLANAMVQGFDATAAAATRMQQKLKPAIDELQVAKEEFLSLAGGTGDGAAATGPTPLDMYSSMIAGFWARMSTVADRAKGVGKKIASAFENLWEFRKELGTRYALANATEEEGRRIQLMARFANEEAEAIKKFGKNGQVLGALRQVQLEELKRFNQDLAEEQAKKAADERKRREEEVRSLLESVAPAERFLNEKDKIEAAFRDGLIKPEFRKNFDDYLFQLELSTDRTFGGRLSESIWDFRNTFNDSLASMVETSRFSFGEIAEQFRSMLLRMAMMELIVAPFFQGAISYGRGLFASTPKPVVHGEANVPWEGLATGAIVRKPVDFYADGQHWKMGEAGPEAIVPLDETGGLGGVVVQVIDQRGSGAPVTVDESSSGGRKLVRVLIRDEVNQMVDDGSLDRRMKSRFNIGPSPNRR
ncbi:MAG TPA: hypothetical protein VK176_01710, partial [Phycisphaerales bacterium]|nr:hypothetical protein [Phycisphaerales bacterium]